MVREFITGSDPFDRPLGLALPRQLHERGLWDLFLGCPMHPAVVGACRTRSLAFSTSRCHSCEAYERSERCSRSSGISTVSRREKSNGGEETVLMAPIAFFYSSQARPFCL